MDKPRKTEKDLKLLIQKRWGASIGGLTVVPGREGYWNVLPLRTNPTTTLESQVRFEELIASMREEFDLET
jgi:hypothetical protein